MALLGSALCPSTSFCISHPKLKYSRHLQPRKQISNLCVISSSNGSKLMTKLESSTAEKTTFGFKNLTETFWVDVQRAEGRPLTVKLNAPLTIGSSMLENLENVAIRVELSNGCVGWGEASVLPSDTNGYQAMALAKAMEACQFLQRSPPMTLNLVLDQIGGILPGFEFASVRAGVEMAIIDAIANSLDVPICRLFGGASNSLITTITVPTVSLAEASELATKYCKQGFKTLRLRVGKNINADIEVIQAIQAVHPHCSIILDASEEYTFQEAIVVLEKLHDIKVIPVLLEQPVHRGDWKGLSDVSRIARDKYGISVAADESCQSLSDVKKLLKENIVDAINIKLSKFGVLGALEIIDMTRKSGLNLIIEGMAETRLATGFAGHLAAGIGCFKYVSLGTPHLLSGDPVVGGCEAIYFFFNA